MIIQILRAETHGHEASKGTYATRSTLAPHDKPPFKECNPELWWLAGFWNLGAEMGAAKQKVPEDQMASQLEARGRSV
jgi:hypothetical protein